MFPKFGLSDIELRLQVLDELQNDQANGPMIVSTLSAFEVVSFLCAHHIR